MSRCLAMEFPRQLRVPSRWNSDIILIRKISANNIIVPRNDWILSLSFAESLFASLSALDTPNEVFWFVYGIWAFGLFQRFSSLILTTSLNVLTIHCGHHVGMIYLVSNGPTTPEDNDASGLIIRRIAVDWIVSCFRANGGHIPSMDLSL